MDLEQSQKKFRYQAGPSDKIIKTELNARCKRLNVSKMNKKCDVKKLKLEETNASYDVLLSFSITGVTDHTVGKL